MIPERSKSLKRSSYMPENRICSNCENLRDKNVCHVYIPKCRTEVENDFTCPRWEIKKKVLGTKDLVDLTQKNTSSPDLKIKDYSIKYLDGRTLEIRVQQEGSKLFMFGYEQETDIVYLIGEFEED